ncbi:zf-HC2 domain-containing protein [Streptacidiphilus fuscans]|uniref:Zf-HC2 domain-containing protein n=1 Tax=Streptacidiphilus fuscans TaxID=2789292 RepID=A0A931B9R0_9ACTN|nr:zf-HC2 domain-containing protein [Streptacidiphilus fuscans]MBF9072142.1 zf-HC2 domain-containing protein [Streptacidiphilus fuscans]MBF9072953.1 zf-HC2 domain-containing protein [Streptacidiphilus fuscans]
MSGHEALRSLLGAWALDACRPDEAARLEAHLADCPSCAEEAHRLRDAAGWLSSDEPLDPDPGLRRQVMAGCLEIRDADFRVPSYADPYVAETARLDALLRDLGELDWLEQAQLTWHGGSEQRRPAEVLSHLAAVDGVLADALGLPDPLDRVTEPKPAEAADGPGGHVDVLVARTTALREAQSRRPPESVRAMWRAQTRAVVETAALAAEADPVVAEDGVDYGAFELRVADSFLDRAFECWIHADDIAEAVSYPYHPPRGAHMRQLIGLAVRLLPLAMSALRASGEATSPDPVPGEQSRVVKLIVEGRGEGEWLIPIDAPGWVPPTDVEPTATLAIDGVEFCFLCAARRDPHRVPVGIKGDAPAARDLLAAARLLSRP